jgi:hypothetical protein
VHSLFFLCLVLFFLPVGPPFLIADFGNSVEMFTALRGEFPSLNQKLTGRILFTTNFTAGPRPVDLPLFEKNFKRRFREQRINFFFLFTDSRETCIVDNLTRRSFR